MMQAEVAMSKLMSSVAYVSLRHARAGKVGNGGQLPAGWAGELTSELQIEDTNVGGAEPLISLRFRFDESIGSDYVSIVVAPYTECAPGDVYVLSAASAVTEAENLATAFAIIREWEPNGKFIRQVTRPFKIDESDQPVLVALEVREAGRLLQPVVSFKRSDSNGGGGVISLSGLSFMNLYSATAS
jgi:hypothetical protein